MNTNKRYVMKGFPLLPLYTGKDNDQITAKTNIKLQLLCMLQRRGRWFYDRITRRSELVRDKRWLP